MVLKPEFGKYLRRFEVYGWRRMEVINWTDCVKNEVERNYRDIIIPTHYVKYMCDLIRQFLD
jgi:hypothetical protein